ncbi:hypothetical protein [Pseudomonas asiatica]|uniref:hypothetical protein n=1 Tax=Pseudomonas asiatica TaxID=2219225 RepID=UPI0032EBEB1E
MNWRSEMSKPMKRSAFFLSAAMAGLFAVYAPSSWSGDNNQQPADATKAKGAQGMDHGSMKGMDHGAMKGMDHGSMKGMDHGSMQGMDHGKMMESHGSDKAEAGKDAQ